MKDIEQTYMSFSNSDSKTAIKSLYKLRKEVLKKRGIKEIEPHRITVDNKNISLQSILYPIYFIVKIEKGKRLPTRVKTAIGYMPANCV